MGKQANKATPANLAEWAFEAEKDLDGLNALRLRKAGAELARLNAELAKSQQEVSTLLLRIDRMTLEAAGLVPARRVVTVTA